MALWTRSMQYVVRPIYRTNLGPRYVCPNDCASFSCNILIRCYSDRESDDANEKTKLKAISKRSALGPKGCEIGSSSVLLQDGLSFQELPILVKKTYQTPDLIDSMDEMDKTVDIEPESCSIEQNEEFNKVVKLHLRQLNNILQVLQYLQIIPPSDVTPLVSLSILERIVELQNDSADSGEIIKQEYTESAIICTLCDVICRSSRSNILLNGMELVIKFRLQLSDKKKYIDIFVKECLERLHGGKLSLLEICRLVENLFNAGSSYQLISDNVWSEILARESEINIENINRIFALLLYLKSSQQIVLRMLERITCSLEVYSKLEQKQIVHILHILCLLKLNSYRLFSTVSCWTRLNIHRVTESGLRDVIMLMNSIPFTDHTLETALERFMKAKGKNCSDTLLMTAITEKVKIFRWRSPVVLENVSDYFLRNAGHLSTDTLGELINVFGLVNFEPYNSFRLFEVLEKILSEKIPDFDPDTIISILLSCVYIQRYPLNFVKKLFSPGFLDRLNFQAANDEVRRRKAYNDLRLLDTALHLECPTYPGPYLPRTRTTKYQYRDGRIYRIRGKMEALLSQLLGSESLFSTFVHLPKLPRNELYIVDFMINLDKVGKPVPTSFSAGIYEKIAVLLLLPEYFCNCQQEVLIGPQAMRMRHLKLLGLTVVQLHVAVLEQLENSQKELLEYLEKKLSPNVTLIKKTTND